MSETKNERDEARLARIRETLCPTLEGYSAEPLDIEDAKWLLDELIDMTQAQQADHARGNIWQAEAERLRVNERRLQKAINTAATQRRG